MVQYLHFGILKFQLIIPEYIYICKYINEYMLMCKSAELNHSNLTNLTMSYKNGWLKRFQTLKETCGTTVL